MYVLSETWRKIISEVREFFSEKQDDLVIMEAKCQIFVLNIEKSSLK